MDQFQDNAKDTLILTLTERCNLACTYCYEHDKSAAVMPVAKALVAINHSFQRNPERELYIQFHGGEPLMAFAEMKEICETIWSKGHQPRPYMFTCSTNGTLLKGETKRWLKDHHQGIWLGLSLDGTPEMHNINRSNSFKDIDLDFFLEHWPHQPVKMTVSRETMPKLAEGVIYMQERGFAVGGSLAYGIEWKPEDYGLYAREMYKLADYYLTHPEREPTLLFTDKLYAMRSYEEEKDFRWCAAGKYMSCVGMDGAEYACQVFMPSVQADTDDVLERKSKAQALLRNAAADITDPVCKKCAIYSACPTCYGMNFVDRKDLGNKGQDNCTFAMIRVKASAYLFGSMLANEESYPYMKAMPDHRKLRLIEAIETIEEAIPDQILAKKIRGEIKGMGL